MGRTPTEVPVPINEPPLFNAADYLVHRRIADGAGDRVALVHPGGELRYRELSEVVHAVAGGLSGLGVRAEERVLFFASDTPELAIGILAAMHLGAVAVPVSTMLTSADLAGMLRDSRARVLVVSAEFADVARAAVSRLTRSGAGTELAQVLTIGAAPEGFPVSALAWAALVEAGRDRPVPPYPSWADSPALWLYTSGTTGNPKAAMHRHGDIRFVCESYGQRVLGIRGEDRCFSVAKLFFAYGIGNSLFFPLSAGAAAVLEPRRPNPELVAELVARHRATLFFGVPTFFSAMLGSSIPDDAFASVRRGASAGEPLPANLFTGVLDRFGFEVLDGIGSTEALHIFLSNRPGQVHPGSSGSPVPGYTVQLRDDTDGTVIDEPDRPGSLYVRGESIAAGYWCRAAATRQAFAGEWLRTGDTYLRNTDGSYSYLGRSDDMIKAGGIWVSPGEVEARLLEHESVLEVAVVAVPGGDGLEKPVAVVVAHPGTAVREDELVEFCRAGLSSFKRPRRVVLVDELPRTATGKLQRFRVRELARERDPEVSPT
jgi:benzoate-CoA ligase